MKDKRKHQYIAVLSPEEEELRIQRLELMSQRSEIQREMAVCDLRSKHYQELLKQLRENAAMLFNIS